MDIQLQELIEFLGLEPHPEGGHYKETFRPNSVIQTKNGLRNTSTAIYYALAAGDYSGWHRVQSDEGWHHYGGEALRLHLLDDKGYRTIVLGPELMQEQQPQFIVPAGTWQAAEGPRSGYALCGCTVAPGFDFADFEMGTEAGMLREFPEAGQVIPEWIRS